MITSINSVDTPAGDSFYDRQIKLNSEIKPAEDSRVDAGYRQWFSIVAS